ncbi:MULTISPECIES: FAD-dependent oxidoreductase [unclassified Sphingomonas]|uniref:FAD-dependent oxidoreductase n=1 Tax=unclassified Sphingomonas TaxID=196159 RepID=UPI000928129B|nr:MULTISPECIES: FAD-dependent oxidoreductase [unclassified Sphingomonas]MBN8846722.1 FAD-dependent oxidoreductase [Sphingomonas sp.]OJV32531.1 MAG: pyridine nucleotide-disulfide oxidoreductase [Sphingomonas sp. 67-36]
MRHVAVIGSGPAGYYTAEACQKAFGESVRVDIIDRLPVPYGLIRTGVAPDHQSIKAVSKRYEATALSDNVRFVGNVTVGQDVSIPELLDLYDAVVLATGAPHDRPLGIPGDDLPGVIGSAAFVGWYNGHPDFARLDPPLAGPGAVIVGAGNVALDVARILAKTGEEFAGSDIVGHALAALEPHGIRDITILARRGPHEIAMTPKELGELGHLSRATPLVDPADLPPADADAALEPGLRKSVSHLRAFAGNEPAAPVSIHFDFFAMPVAIEGDGKVERVIVERTRLDDSGRATGTGETYAIPAGLVVSCIGYHTPPIEGVPYDAKLGRFANDEGRIAPGLYAVGWARRGPTGTIGTNRPDGFLIAEQIAADIPADSAKKGRVGLDDLFSARGVDVVTFRDWQGIERAEIANARDGAPREKFTSLDAMLAARK